MNSSIESIRTRIEPSETFFILVFSFIILLVVMGTIMSLIFIICILRNNTLQSVSSLLSCNSCVLGLFYFLFHLFYVIIAFYPLPTYREKSIVCYTIGYMYSVTCCGISWSHAVLATSRLCFSLFPRRRRLLTYTFAWYLIAIHWIITFGLPLPLIYFDAYQYQHESRMCILTTRKTSTSLIGVILFYNIPFTSVIIVYILVWCHARRSTNGTVSRSTRDLAIMHHILTLVIIDLICGHPYMTLILLDYLGIASKEWYLSVTVFITLSVTANMYTIIIFNRKLRKILCMKLSCLRIPPSNPSTTTSAMIPMRTLTLSIMNINLQTNNIKTSNKYEIDAIDE